MYNGTTSTTSGFDSDTTADGAVQRGVQQVGERLHDTIERVAEPVRGAVDRASSGAHKAVDKMASGVHTAAEKVDEQARRVRVMPDQAMEQARDCVRGRPLQAVGAALALGWLLGRLSH